MIVCAPATRSSCWGAAARSNAWNSSCVVRRGGFKPAPTRPLFPRAVDHHIGDTIRFLVVVVYLLEHPWCPPVALYLSCEGWAPDHDQRKLLLVDIFQDRPLVPVAVKGELGHLERLEVDPPPSLG